MPTAAAGARWHAAHAGNILPAGEAEADSAAAPVDALLHLAS